jgi:hypothetical protein
MSCQLHAPASLPPGKQPPGTHWIGGWVGLRVGLEDMEKRKFLTIPGVELQPLGRPARSQSLYRLSYPGSSRLSTYPPKGFTNGDESRVGYCKHSRHVYCTWSIPELIPAVREMENREESKRCRLRYEWPRVIPEVAVGTCGRIHIIALSKTKSKTKRYACLLLR